LKKKIRWGVPKGEFYGVKGKGAASLGNYALRKRERASRGRKETASGETELTSQ